MVSFGKPYDSNFNTGSLVFRFTFLNLYVICRFLCSSFNLYSRFCCNDFIDIYRFANFTFTFSDGLDFSFSNLTHLDIDFCLVFHVKVDGYICEVCDNFGVKDRGNVVSFIDNQFFTSVRCDKNTTFVTFTSCYSFDFFCHFNGDSNTFIQFVTNFCLVTTTISLEDSFLKFLNLGNINLVVYYFAKLRKIKGDTKGGVLYRKHRKIFVVTHDCEEIL